MGMAVLHLAYRMARLAAGGDGAQAAGWFFFRRFRLASCCCCWLYLHHASRRQEPVAQREHGHRQQRDGVPERAADQARLHAQEDERGQGDARGCECQQPRRGDAGSRALQPLGQTATNTKSQLKKQDTPRSVDIVSTRVW